MDSSDGEGKQEFSKDVIPASMRSTSVTCNLYPLANYSFGTKTAMPEKDATVAARFERMRKKYEAEGMRRSVDGVLLVHNHGHPHILLMQLGSAFFKVPGGSLKPGEAEVDGLKRKLTRKLGAEADDFVPDWEIGDLLATWWRPNFDPLQYPYLPPHVSKPKECRRMYLVYLPEKSARRLLRSSGKLHPARCAVV